MGSGKKPHWIMGASALFFICGLPKLANAQDSCSPEILRKIFDKNTALLKTDYVDPGIMCRYNLKKICTIKFSKASLRDMRALYQHSRISNLVKKIALGENVPYNDLAIIHPDLVEFKPTLRTIVSANPPRLSEQKIITAFTDGSLDQIKNEPDGLSLLAWYVHPELKSRLLHASCPECVRYMDLNPSGTYLTTIMDLNRSHIAYLKALKQTAIDHLTKHYGYKKDQDVLSLFFHFPTGPDTSSLHMHIRLNQNFPPTEMARNYDIDAIIQYLENNKSISDLILDRQEFLGGFTPIAPDVAKYMGDLAKPTINYRENPFYLRPGDK